MISHIVSAFSGKPVFGQLQDGPCNQNVSTDYIATYYMQERNITIYFGTIIIILVFVSIIVIIHNRVSNPQVTNAHLGYLDNNYLSYFGMLVGTSETVRMFSNYGTSRENADLKIRQWIAGIIDGDGSISISKKGYCTIEIVIEIRDIACFSKIKHRYGGSIKPVSHAKAFRYRLHHIAGIKIFINDINGILYNPIRIEQFQKLCNLYNVEIKAPSTLIYNNAYLSGLFDSDGSIYMNLTTNQVFITISQKNRELLDLVCSVYGGKVYSANKNETAYKWTVYKKEDIISLIDNYFHWNNCVSAKNKRFKRVKEFYRLSAIGVFNSNNVHVTKIRENFVEQWKEYADVHNLLKRQSIILLYW